MPVFWGLLNIFRFLYWFLQYQLNSGVKIVAIMTRKKKAWQRPRFKQPPTDSKEQTSGDKSKQASSLTPNQKKKSVSNKLKKKAKPALYTPYKSVWPVVSDQDTKDILSKLETIFSNEVPGDTSITPATPSVKSKEKNKNPLRIHLSMGMNCVTKALEAGTLRLVIVEVGACWALHKHLIQLSQVRGCPALAIHGLADTACPLLGLSSLSAVGFKESVDELGDDVRDAIAYIQGKAPPIDSSCFDSIKQNETDTNCDAPSAHPDAPEVLPEPTKDYSHLYIYKSEKKTDSTENLSFNQPDFIAFGSGSSSDSSDEFDEPLPLSISVSSNSGNKRKRPISHGNQFRGKRPRQNKQQHISSIDQSSIYQSSNLGKVVANTQRSTKP